MPQFDTFSFFSQLFWVFTGFLTLYLAVCMFLLPALSAVLKIRKHKLSQVSSSGGTVELVNNTNFITTIKHILAVFNSKVVTLSDPSSTTGNLKIESLKKDLNSVSVKFEASREFNLNVFSQAQRVSILHG